MSLASSIDYDMQNETVEMSRTTAGRYSLQRYPIVPVGVEVADAQIRDDGIEPGKHQFLWWHLALADLVAKHEMPDEREDQLQVAVDDVLCACIIAPLSVVSAGSRTVLLMMSVRSE